MELCTGSVMASRCCGATGIGRRSGGLLQLHNHRVLSTRAAATSTTESSEDRGGETFRLEPVKKQRRRSQWSTGYGPGEYGGPPLDAGFRKSWGGGDGIDPLQGTGDYIWKKKWQPHVETPPSEYIPPPSKAKEPDSGFLSLNRAIALDSLDVDLSQELMKPSKATLQRQVEEASRADAAEQQIKQEERIRWRFAPTRREEVKWSQARNAATGGSEMMAREVERAQIDQVSAAKKEKERYIKLKQDLQILTLAIGSCGLASAYFSYSPEVAGSYGAGLIGAVAYIRMLGNSVDSLGARDVGSAARGASGQARLLVPVVLVMVYNRWNALLVPELHLMSLQLIPMLVGFFTYKAATLVETFRELLPKQPEEDIQRLE